MEKLKSLSEEDYKTLRAILDGIGEGISIIDENMKVVWVNSVVERWVGRLEDIKGEYCYKIHQKRANPCENCPTIKTFKTGKIEKARQYAYDTEGNIRYFEFISTPIINERGQIISVIERTVELTTELELKHLFKETKKRLQAIFDGIEDGISVINRNYEIVRVNRSILSMFKKRDFSDLLGKKCFKVYYQFETICDNCPAEKTFHEGRAIYINRISREISKEKVILDNSTFPIKDEEGNVIQVIEYIRDVTPLVKLENQLFYSERLAGIGELAAGIVHEIRNPLSTIMAGAQLCLSKYELDEELRRHFKMILKNSGKINKVISDLLRLSSPHEVFLKIGSINKVIDAACNLVKIRCLKQQVYLIKKLPRILPQILLDEKLLVEAFLNIIVNALDSMPKGGKLDIVASYDPENEKIVISFSDSGCGIPEENLSKIFDPFFTTKKEGIGLGFSLVYKIINSHKGNIHVESKIGHGTKVIVNLPIYKDVYL